MCWFVVGLIIGFISGIVLIGYINIGNIIIDCLIGFVVGSLIEAFL